MRVLLLGILVLAGCAEQAVPDPAPADPAPEDAAPEDPAPEADHKVLARAERPRGLHNVTDLYWATAAELGDMAFEWVLDFGNANECQVASAVTGAVDGTGTYAVFLRESGWGASGGGTLVSVDTPLVGSDDLLGGGGRYGSGSAVGGTFSGTHTFTRVALGVQPVDSTDMNSGYSLSFSVSCSQPFDLLAVHTGSEALVGDTNTMDMGVAASAFPAGGVGTGVQGLSITSDVGHVRFGSFGDQAGRIILYADHDEQTYVLPLESSGHLTSGPGRYAVNMDRAGVRFEAYWHAIYAVPDFVDLEPGLLDEPAYWPR